MADLNPNDAATLNRLFASEMKRVGKKTAADNTPEQAFKDHDEFNKLVESVLNEDKKTSFDPNGDFSE